MVRLFLKKTWLQSVVYAIMIVVGILAIIILVPRAYSVLSPDILGATTDAETYQAVFLANNQIYFGRLKNINSDYLILSDVYYVKINESGAGQLVKLGAGEPHGPRDEMIINQDQVLFWENLNFDSPVVKTIQSIQSQGK
ncbi:MAG: hypothetical protein AAB857_00710 [Patescibacteria group bacterium]